ncbi:MAG: FKBP-type peptidyl-prolyl cis-trans isomerase [Deltaproteobacteria bacterium]|nr:FKBP-type peptidyl-prolyl cis-trans isomerase [Deltaproteobacteria bacterium]
MRFFLIAVSAGVMAVLLSACNRGKLETDKEQQSYAVGFTLGQQLSKVKDNVDPEIVALGIKDGIRSDGKLDTTVVSKRVGELQQKQRENELLAAALMLKKSQDYIATVALKKGVRVLDAGLLIEEMKPGSGGGRTLNDDDEIILRYTAKQIDGSIFDQRTDPKGFRLRYRDLLLPGLKKAIQKIPIGANWTVYLAPEQAFGAGSRPGVPSQSAVVYEIELLSVVPNSKR